MVSLQTRLNQLLRRVDAPSSTSRKSFHHGCLSLEPLFPQHRCRTKPCCYCLCMQKKLSRAKRKLLSANFCRVLRIFATNSLVAPPSAWPAENLDRIVSRDLPDVVTLSNAVHGFFTCIESFNIAGRGSNSPTDTQLLANEGAEVGTMLELKGEREDDKQEKQIEHSASSFSLENDMHSVIPEDERCIVEAERLRRKRLSEANKNQVPWNKGKGKGKIKNYKQGLQSNGAAISSHIKPKAIESDAELLIKEKQRRQRIGAAIAGKPAWNKGRKLSEEERQRIKQRTLEAMKNPKVRERLRVRSTLLSNETKSKIKAAMIRSWQERKKLKFAQETLVEEWKEYVAENARSSFDGDITYSWDSYDTILRELQNAWRLKNMRSKAKLCRSKSPAHRSEISKPMKAKVTDSGVKTLQPKQKGLPPYRNSSNSEMLERLKQMRAKRWLECPQRNASIETTPRRALQRARILMEKAQMAARVLEFQAAMDKGALPALQDAQQLLSEAEESLKAAGCEADIGIDSLVI